MNKHSENVVSVHVAGHSRLIKASTHMSKVLLIIVHTAALSTVSVNNAG